MVIVSKEGKNMMSENTIMIRVVNQTQGLKKRAEIKKLLDSGANLVHVDFRKFNDGTDGLFLVFDSSKQSTKGESDE